MSTPPGLDEKQRLHAIAAAHDVQMSDVDVEAVMAFLRVLEPQLRALEEIVASDSVPAALFLPTDTP